MVGRRLVGLTNNWRDWTDIIEYDIVAIQGEESLSEPLLLHEANLSRIPIVGERMAAKLLLRIGELATATSGLVDPDVSIVIRSHNNAAQLDGLLDDIEAQDYCGEKELIVVDSESSDGSVQVARRHGATVVPFRDDTYNYPKALNYGFGAAQHGWVFSFVEHSALAHNLTLKTATRWSNEDGVAIVSGVPLPNSNATLTERLFSTGLMLPTSPLSIARRAHHVTKSGMGIPGSNCSVTNHSLWAEVGGFDESYGAGGEDGAIGRAMLEAGYSLVFDPALSPHHSHGLGPINSARQIREWSHMREPRDFDLQRLQFYRHDL